jgi:flavodoxin
MKNIDRLLVANANTKTIAEIIQKNVGGDLVSLELEKAYPENYQARVDQVAKENETVFADFEN